jgi:hypothetical protein
MDSRAGQKYSPVSLEGVRTYSVGERATKVRTENFLAPTAVDPSLLEFLNSLPEILKAAELRAVVDAIVRAYLINKPVVLGIGGHVIKCGLAPLLIQLLERNVITAIAMNGGASIHDFEVATLGRTSEDVAASLETGMFGMVSETGEAMNAAIVAGAEREVGMGAALGLGLAQMGAPYVTQSLLATGVRLGAPILVHVAMGADTIHMHAGASGAAIGQTSHHDFRVLVSILKDLGNGGVYLNIGSSTLLPEVFLKALNLARNLSSDPVENFTTVNMDMIQHYRPLENVVRRPTQKNTGKGYFLTGHHEIMVPLVFHCVLAKLAAEGAPVK